MKLYYLLYNNHHYEHSDVSLVRMSRSLDGSYFLIWAFADSDSEHAIPLSDLKAWRVSL